MEGMPNTKYEQVKKDLELQRAYERYCKAKSKLSNVLWERLVKVENQLDDADENVEFGLWDFINYVSSQLDAQGDIDGMHTLINRKQGVYRGVREVKMDYSPLD